MDQYLPPDARCHVPLRFPRSLAEIDKTLLGNKYAMASIDRHGQGWRIRWFDEDGRRRAKTFKLKPDAVLHGQRKAVEVEEIKRGLRKLRPKTRSCDDIFDRWIAIKAPEKRSGETDESFIRVHLRPFFGGRSLESITPSDIEQFKAERKHLTKNTVNHHLSLLISMLRYAKDEFTWLDSVPRIRKYKLPRFPTDYSYLQTVEERDRFLGAARDEGEHVHIVYATAILTGMRLGEIAGLLWSDINFERRLIVVQRTYEDRPTKNGEMRYVPILDPLLPLLRRWRTLQDGLRTFTNAAGSPYRRDSRIFDITLKRVIVAAGLPPRYITFHDLRHTFASHWMMAGGDLFKLQRILGHKTMDMPQRYSHLASEAFVADYGRLGAAAETRPLVRLAAGG